MPVVKMPDGTLVQMPDNPDPALLAELSRLSPQPDGPLKRQAKLIGSDVVKGALATPMLAGDALSGTPDIDPHISPLGAASNSLGAGEDTYGQPRKASMGASQALQNFGVKPETTAERWQSVLTQGAAGGLASPGSFAHPVMQGVTGASAAGGSELAAKLVGDNPLVRILGGLAGGGVGAVGANFANRSSPRVQELARESLDGITPQQLDDARTFMAGAGANDMPVDFSQALEATGAQPTGLRVLRDTLANVKEGDATQALLKAQPGKLQTLSNRWIDNQPGQVYSPEQAANNLGQAATGTINAAKAERSAIVRGQYDAAGDLPPSTIESMSSFLKQFLNKPGISDTTKRAAAGLQAKLQAPDVADEVSQLQAAWKTATKASEKAAITAKIQALNQRVQTPVTLHAKDADTMIGQFVGDFKGTPLSPTNPVVRGETKAIGAGLNRALRDGSPALKQADDEFGRISREVVDPLKQGPIGMLAGRRGYSADTQTPVARMNALFNAGRDPAAKHSPLLEAARKLNKTDPEAFRDSAKTFYSGKIAEAFDAGIGASGRATNKDAGERLYKSLFADSKQYTGMRDVVTASAESAGRPPAEALRGLENFAKIVRATRSQPDAIGGMTRQQIMEIAEKHYGANAVRIFGFLPFERMARNMESATMTKTFRELDKLITTPEGVDILIKLSKIPVMDKRAMALAATAGGMLQFAGQTAPVKTP